jgi:hypothetical protein
MVKRIVIPLFGLVICKLLISCEDYGGFVELPTSQMMVIVDKSRSIKYISPDDIKLKIRRYVNTIYHKKVVSEKFSLLNINQNTGAISFDDRFDSPCATKDLSSSRNKNDQNSYSDCLFKKNAWRNKIINKVDEVIKQQNNAPATDVIGIFSAINNVVSNRDKSVDSFHVIILSDLVNTVDKSKGSEDIRNGRDDFNQYLKNHRVSKLPVFAKVFVKIIAPDSYVFKQSDLNYWTEFFTAFGVEEIKFER